MNARVVVALVAAAGQLSAQAIVRGAVMTEQGQRIQGVELRVVALNKTVRTDSTGEYRLVLPPGTYRMTIRAMGFFSSSDTIQPEKDVELIHDFTLVSLAKILDTVTTSASAAKYRGAGLRGFEARRQAGMGSYVTEEMFRRYNTRILADVLRRVPGIAIRASRSTANYAASQRNGGCMVSVFLDGLPLFNGGGTMVFDLNQLHTSTLAAAEFYASAASAPVEFRDRTGCGMLLLWTRER